MGERALPEANCDGTLTLNFRPSHLWGNQFLLLTPRICGSLLKEPKQTNRAPDAVFILSFLFSATIVWLFLSPPEFMLKFNPQCKSIGGHGLLPPSSVWWRTFHRRRQHQHAISDAESSPHCTESARALGLDILPFRTVKNKFLFFINYPVSRILLQQHRTD